MPSGINGLEIAAITVRLRNRFRCSSLTPDIKAME
jgi:hypothetical protein